MGLFLEMFNSGSRGVLCKTWVLHTNNVKEVQKLFFFQARSETTLFHNQKAFREQNWSSVVAEHVPPAEPWDSDSQGCTQSHFHLEQLHLYFFQWRDKIVFARKGQNKSELKMDIKGTVTVIS